MTRHARHETSVPARVPPAAPPVRRDMIATMTARMVGGPMAVWSLIGDGRERILGSYGVPDRWLSDFGTFAAHIAAADRPVSTTDAATVDVLRDHPLVRVCGIRALLGVPVRARDGTAVGALTVLDTVAHAWTEADLAVLAEMEILLRPAADPPQHLVERFRDCHRRVIEAFEANPSVADALPAVLAAVGEAAGWAGVELSLASENTGELRVAGRWGDATASPRFDVPVQSGTDTIGTLTGYGATGGGLTAVLLEGVAAQVGAFMTLDRARSLTYELTHMQDDFVSLVGHELRTPLAAIAAHAEILGEDSDDFDPESRVAVESLIRNVAEVHRIVAILLDLAGLESGQLPLVVGSVDLTALVTGSINAVRDEAAGRGLRLRVDAASDVMVTGDRRRLREVADHLLSNAVKFSRPGGNVRVTVRYDADLAELRVTDDGIGMPASERHLVFERFVRGSNVRHNNITGFGLGLSLVRTIVRLHGGTVSFRSQLPSGAEVVVRIPRTHDAAGVGRRPRVG